MTGMVQARAEHFVSGDAAEKLPQFVRCRDVRSGRVNSVVGFTGGSAAPTPAACSSSLKDLNERKVGVDEVIARIRRKTAEHARAQLYSCRRCRISASAAAPAARSTSTRCRARTCSAEYWAPQILPKLRTVPELLDVNSDQQDRGLQAYLSDRPRYGFAARAVAQSTSIKLCTTPSASARSPPCTRR